MKKLAILLLVLMVALCGCSESPVVTTGSMVYRTEHGEKYHREGCYYLKSKIEITVESAKAMGLTPCSKCDPPQ